MKFKSFPSIGSIDPNWLESEGAKLEQSFKFKHGNMHGKIKQAEPQDNPGELMVITMPMAANVDMSGKGSKLVECPLCGGKCWAQTQLAEVVKIYAGRVIAACTECSIRANINKGELPRRLHEKGLLPNDLLIPILKLLNESTD